MFQIFKKEIGSFLGSLVGYIIIGVFLTLCGVYFWSFSDFFGAGVADMYNFFQVAPFVYLFLIPAITMKMFSEEKKSGTMELLFTKPISVWDIILGKYLAACLLIFISLLPTLFYFYSIYQMGNPVGNIDVAATCSSYLGLFLLGCVFASIGIFSSSLTDNQVVAFVVSFVICLFLYYAIAQIASLSIMGSLSYIISKIGLDYQYESLSKGLIDTRNLIYFFSVIFIALWCTKWRVLKG
ncbi:MAG: gliding motility-associated ABC transporter permease subunit GldF [Pseudarcicella sp.]|nr:gliding motility-associated ABC transporter permease subunit GldF [Pseudarcicella sp.]